jgi:type II secretory pathway component PulF
MPRFRYSALDSLGQSIQGELVATNVESAQLELSTRGLTCQSLTQVEVAPMPLASGEAEQIVATLAEVSDSELPLADGLRAAARECINRRIVVALNRIADDIDAGHPLEHIMTARSHHLPPYLRGLVVTGARANRLSTVLGELVEHHLVLRDTHRQILASMGYPILVLIATFVLLGVTAFWIVPQFKLMFLEWELKLPAATQAMIGLSDLVRWLVLGPGIRVLISLVAVSIAICVLIRITFGNGIPHRLASTLPLIGPMWQWSAIAGYVRLLAILLEEGLPLSRALELIHESIPNPPLQRAAQRLAAGAAQGRSLHAMAAEMRAIPASIVPFIRWGEKVGQLPAALRTIHQLLLSRVRIRVVLLQSIGPPFVFIFTALVMGLISFALFMPLVSLLQGLSF